MVPLFPPIDMPAPVPRVSDAGAVISDDRHYRYRLWRYWSDDPHMTWVMLNPSTADETRDDATLKRCMSFARREGCGGIEVVNLYALRTAYPAKLRQARPHGFDPEEGDQGSNMDAWTTAFELSDSGLIVAGWGNAARFADLPESRAWRAWRGLVRWSCLGVTKTAGEPRHPVRLSGSEPFVPYAVTS